MLHGHRQTQEARPLEITRIVEGFSCLTLLMYASYGTVKKAKVVSFFFWLCLPPVFAFCFLSFEF